jgi:hypothetical protein
LELGRVYSQKYCWELYRVGRMQTGRRAKVKMRKLTLIVLKNIREL